MPFESPMLYVSFISFFSKSNRIRPKVDERYAIFPLRSIFFISFVPAISFLLMSEILVIIPFFIRSILQLLYTTINTFSSSLYAILLTEISESPVVFDSRFMVLSSLST